MEHSFRGDRSLKKRQRVIERTEGRRVGRGRKEDIEP